MAPRRDNRATPRRPAIAVACAALAALALGVGAPAAHGAAVALVDPSPPDGAVLPTQPSPYRVPLVWSADIAGCGPGTARAEVVVRGPRGEVTRGGLEGAPPSGGQSFVVSPRRRSTYEWFVELTCPGLGPVLSEQRSFTLTGPNPAPRLHGRIRATFPRADAAETWRFRAACPAGACATVVRRPGARPSRLRYEARRRIYRGRFGPVAAPVEAVCALGASGDRRRVPGTYRARSVAIAVRVVRTDVDATGVQRRAVRLVGRSTGRYVPNARGRRLGCRAGRITTPIVLERVLAVRSTGTAMPVSRRPGVLAVRPG